jgi:hypothetical protein
VDSDLDQVSDDDLLTVSNNNSDVFPRSSDDLLSVFLGFLNDLLSLDDFDSQFLENGDLVHFLSPNNQLSDSNDNSCDTFNSDDDFSHDDLNFSDNNMDVTDCLDFVYMDLDTVFMGNVDGFMDNLLGLVGNMYLVPVDDFNVVNDDLLDDNQMFLGLNNSLHDYLLVRDALDLSQFNC